MIKVLVFGSTGQLAYELQQTAPEDVKLTCVGRDVLDLSQAEQIAGLIKAQAPDVVINAAAYTAVDRAETEVELAFAINAIAPAEMAKACAALAIPFFHISTDFVFGGEGQSLPYLPGAEKSPQSVYGESKLKGEHDVLTAHSGATIIRTSWVYSAHGNNFVKTMLKLMAERDQLTIIDDQIGSPTYAKGLAEMLFRLIKRPAQTAIAHYSDLGIASWYDFACAIYQLVQLKGFDVNPNCVIKPIPTSSYPTPAKRPKYSVMDKSELIAHEPDGFNHWLHQLNSMLDVLQEQDHK